MRHSLRFTIEAGIALAMTLLSLALTLHGQATATGRSSHIGTDLPDYVTGDECLFCHRKDIGPGWKVNTHQLTLRPLVAVPEVAGWLKSNPDLEPFASYVQFVLGHETQLRLLKKSNAYGKLDILSAFLSPETRDRETIQLQNPPPFVWNTTQFSQQCAGCHTTAVDARTQAFSQTSIDCYACHGDVDLQHTTEPSKVHLSKTRPHSPRLISETCGQCHIRNGRSKTSRLPYPNNYVVGDDLFHDFEVDLSEEALEQIPPRERHILALVKTTLHNENSENNETCLSCHTVHRSSGRKHRRLPKTDYCFICHQPETMTLTYRRSEKHHALCGY